MTNSQIIWTSVSLGFLLGFLLSVYFSRKEKENHDRIPSRLMWGGIIPAIVIVVVYHLLDYLGINPYWTPSWIGWVRWGIWMIVGPFIAALGLGASLVVQYLRRSYFIERAKQVVALVKRIFSA